MNNCTLVTFLSKLISLVLIFNLVKQENDVDIVFLCLALGNIIAGIVGVVLLNNKAKGWYKKNSLIFPKQLFIESSYVFFSIILVPFYSSINLFILQYFYTPLVVGIYSAAHKIFMACSMLVNVINNTLFPYLAKISITSFDDYKQNVKTTIIMLSIGFSIFSFSIFLFADQIITLVTGANSGYEFNTMALVLKIMCFALLFSPFVSFFFQQIIILNKKRQAIVNIIITIIVNLIVGTILAYLYGVIGMAIGMCITTLLIFTLHFSSVKKHIFQRQNIFLI